MCACSGHGKLCDQLRRPGGALAESFKANTNVVEVDLLNNEIGDCGAAALADALKVNTSVTWIRLAHNKIRPDAERRVDQIEASHTDRVCV